MVALAADAGHRLPGVPGRADQEIPSARSVLDVLRESGLTSSDQALPASVRVKHGVNGAGKAIHYYLNYFNSPATFNYAYGAGRDLPTDHATALGSTISLAPWDLAIVEEAK